MKVFIDFETRSEIDLTAVGADVYAAHPSTEVLCMAYHTPDVAGGVGPLLWTPGDPLSCIAENGRRYRLHAFNAPFEIAIWNRLCVPRYGWEPTPLDRWHCTAARARAVGLPGSLKDAGAALGLDITKSTSGRALMLKMCKPRKPTKNNKAKWHETPEQLEELYEYCRQDVLAEIAIHEATPDLSEDERQTWLLDQTINQRGIPLDVETIRAAVALEDAHATALLAELNGLTGGVVSSPKQIEKSIAWLASQGVNTDSIAKENVEKLLTTELPPRCRRFLEIRQELARSSTAKFSGMLSRVCADGRLRGSHLYHGAITGRWASKGVQTHNIPRGSIKAHDIDNAVAVVQSGNPELVKAFGGSVTETLSGLIRPVIQAPKGKQLIVCDFAAIEARVLAWLASEGKLTSDFRKGRDVYKVLAAKIYDTTVEAVTPAQRFVGKQAVLGLGYGMGAKKFTAQCAKYGVEIDEDFAQNVVKTYRDTYHKVCQFWWRLEDRAIGAVQKPGRLTETHGIEFKKVDRWLMCKLPSGRKIAYTDPEVKQKLKPWGERGPALTYMSVHSQTKKWLRLETYGGKLAENITQAVARDLLVCGMQRLEAFGYPVVMHVHDEAVVEVDGGDVEEVERILSLTPEWAEGCPVAAEGFKAERYRK